MDIAEQARAAANELRTLSNDKRTSALKAMHDYLRDNKDAVLAANRQDVLNAEQADLSPALIKRLDLTKNDKYDSMLQGILDVAALEDPVGAVSLARKLDDGLELFRVSSPIGVLLIIFEARPEVIANIGALAIKSGNAAILKGGKESSLTFAKMSEAIRTALAKTPVPAGALQLVETRDKVAELLQCDELIDMVIPRGSNELVRTIKRSTTIPVLGHADGICAMYVDEHANGSMAAKLAVDAKTNYPAGCNAIETLLVHAKAEAQAKQTIEALLDAGVTVKVAEPLFSKLQAAIPIEPKLQAATDEDFRTEFLAFTIAVKQVNSLVEAINHINSHGSHHTDVIVTEDAANAAKFQKGIDSAGVYWNASSRFADGFRYGFGAEVGVSTNKLHARGPVGLEGLMSYQYLLKGSGQVVGDYIGGGGSRPFQHENL